MRPIKTYILTSPQLLANKTTKMTSVARPQNKRSLTDVKNGRNLNERLSTR